MSPCPAGGQHRRRSARVQGDRPERSGRSSVRQVGVSGDEPFFFIPRPPPHPPQRSIRSGGGGGGEGHGPGTPTTGLREHGNDTSRSTGRSGRQNAATRRNMRREERVTVQGPVKEQQPDGVSHRGGGGGSDGERAREGDGGGPGKY